ncbi:unnamed protein product [Nyctereutes procyonoides]|uniref:Proline-rich protein 3 n=1 Tax=Nyctereutes procyonoides TaxID=34880 RepID=A0A811Y3D7_NYCPR|nr:unnamed protein product [Nyctereutes procyonoides]CAD7672121.1 unnamed protein product [Nyctereutes procyonoides]
MKEAAASAAATSATSLAARAGRDWRLEGWSPIRPPSLLGPLPMANGKPCDPWSATNWNPSTCPPSVEWVNKLLCVHAMGYYTAMKMKKLLLQAIKESQTEKNEDSLLRVPPESRGPMIPPLLSLPPPSWGRGSAEGGLGPRCGPYVMEDKSNGSVCQHFAKKGHCLYEDLCAFYHPGVNGPPL